MSDETPTAHALFEAIPDLEYPFKCECGHKHKQYWAAFWKVRNPDGTLADEVVPKCLVCGRWMEPA